MPSWINTNQLPLFLGGWVQPIQSCFSMVVVPAGPLFSSLKRLEMPLLETATLSNRPATVGFPTRFGYGEVFQAPEMLAWKIFGITIRTQTYHFRGEFTHVKGAKNNYFSCFLGAKLVVNDS